MKFSIIITLLTLFSIGLGITCYLNEDIKIIALGLIPPKISLGFLGVIFLAFSSYQFYQKGWITANPNEWLLIIQNGKLVKSGIGMIYFKPFYQNCVKFPSTMNKVEFSAMQVCLEMQGLQISGFAIWSVHRERPFTYYKSMHGVNSNYSIRQVCESVVRHQIANNELNTVMTKRDELKEKMKIDLQNIFTGWGVWLETVEITEVRICSSTVFENLQTPSKQENYLKAEKYRLKINNEMQIEQNNANLVQFQKSQVQQTKDYEYEVESQIQKIEQSLSFNKKNKEMYQQELYREHLFRMQRLKADGEKKLQVVISDLDARSTQDEAERKRYEEELLAIQNMSEVAQQQYKLDKFLDISKFIKLEDVKVKNYTSPQNNNLMDLIPKVKFQLPNE